VYLFQRGLNLLLSCLAAVCKDISEGVDLGNVTLVRGNLKQRMSEGIAVATRTSLEVVKPSASSFSIGRAVYCNYI